MDFNKPSSIQDTANALGVLYRTVRVLKFYPAGHPVRRSSVVAAHEAMMQALEGRILLLSCGRTGFSFPDGDPLTDTSRRTSALSYELFIRRVQKIIFAHDLFLEDLLELCKILCLSPDTIQQSGGIDAVMAARGIRTIRVNEFDPAAIDWKRRQIEQAGVIPPGIDDVDIVDETPPAGEQPPDQPERPAPERQLQTLLERLATCSDDDTYLLLTRQAVTCADALRSCHEAHLIFPLFDVFAEHADDESRSAGTRECASFAIEQIAATGDVVQTVFAHVDQGNGVSKQALHAIVKAGGAGAMTAAVELMGSTSNPRTRKMLSSLLAGLGEDAVPVLLDFMHDPRWFIIRNICVILGSIASRRAVTALTQYLSHSDLRVRKEAVRSLAQIGGDEAEAAILGILRGADSALYPQAIASLGGMKSRKSVPELMRIICSRDLFLTSLSFKMNALAAITSINDRAVAPQLIALLRERHLLSAARRKTLKTAIAVCLGRLGDVRAVPPLRKLISSGGELGAACAEAIALIESAEGRPGEFSR